MGKHSQYGRYLDGKVRYSIRKGEDPVLTEDGWLVPPAQPATESDRMLGAAEMRGALKSMLQSGGALPEEVARDLAHWLDALDFGKVTGIFKPMIHQGDESHTQGCPSGGDQASNTAAILPGHDDGGGLGKIPGKLPKTAIGFLAIKTAWEIERASSPPRRASAKEVIQRLQLEAKKGDTGIVKAASGREVRWITQSGKEKKYDELTCQKALQTWNKSRNIGT